MSAEEKLRRPTAATEREARRLGWRRDCPVTWREFLEQYPYGVEDMVEERRRAMSDAAA